MVFYSPTAVSAKEKLPFSVGETLEYSVSWEMVPAGKAVFTVMPFSTYHAREAWRFSLKLKSNSFVDVLYKIRDSLESFTDIGFTQSLYYRKTQSGKDKKQIIVAFDWQKNQATYSNFGGKRNPVDIFLHTFDPLSAFYKMRTLPYDENQNLSFPVTDGKKCFIQKGEVIEKQTITIGSKTYDTWVVAPQVNHFSGVFEKSRDPDVRVWIQANHRRIPVRITVKVFIGSVIFDLVSVSG